jgi:hypothetical protein
MTNGHGANPGNIFTRLRIVAQQLIWGAGDPPDFERSVTVVLATFTVFTGYTIILFMTDFSLWLDGIQFLAACITDPNDAANVDYMAKVLAATFIVFLLLDLGAMIRAVQLKWK